LDVLIDAWIDIGNEDWTLDIVGTGNNIKYIRQINKTNKNIKINFFRAVSKKKEKKFLFDKHDFFVLPTKNESFGLVILESMARGLPVLTTNTTPWLNIQKKNAGWIINVSAVELKLVLYKIFCLKKEDFNKKKKNSIKLASKFKWSKIFPLYLKMFQRLM
jgi:glycosyltransferase involved in cell wall biosynthesis